MADPEAGQSYVAKGTSIENLTWYDIGDSTSAQTYLGNLCIKGLVKNEVSDTPSIPDTPDVPDTPDTPDTPDIPDTPDVPDTPDTPDVPDTPDTPDVPDTPDTPEEPEKAKSSDFSKATATMELKSFSWDMLNNTLKFEIEFDYENLTYSKYSNIERHIIWKYKNLDLPLESFSRKERKDSNLTTSLHCHHPDPAMNPRIAWIITT